MKKFILLLVVIIICGYNPSSLCQYLSPKGMMQEIKNNGSEVFQVDLNGEKCALLKISSPNNFITNVEGNIIGDKNYDNNSLNIYITSNSKYLKIFPQTGIPVLLNLKELNNGNNISGGKVYHITLDTKQEIKDLFKNAFVAKNREIPIEEQVSIEELHNLAKNGNVEAVAALGSLNLKSQDYKQAYEYFSKAAEKGNARGYNGLGLLYEFGAYLTKDPDKAFHYYSRAVEHGSNLAYMNIANCYQYGVGTEIDYDKALYYYKKAADKGIEGANGAFAILYYLQAEDKDADIFIEYVSKGKSLDDSDAYLAAGFAYNDGVLVPQDYNLAFRYFQKSYELGNDIALYCLARSFFYGYGTPQNDNKAFLYFKLSAELGNPDSQYYLAECYRYGYGTIQSREKAMEWYQKSAEQDWDEAIEALKEFK